MRCIGTELRGPPKFDDTGYVAKFSLSRWRKGDSEGIGLGIVAATAKGSSRNSNSEANNAAPSDSWRSLQGSKLEISVGSNQSLLPAQNSLRSPKVPSKFLHATMITHRTHLNYLQTRTSTLTAQLTLPHFKSSHIYLNSPNAQSIFSHERSKQIRIGMEHSESYTCVTFHGPKSITKHIYTHFSMDSETLQLPVSEQHEQGTMDVTLSHQSYVNVPMSHNADFLSACYFCKQHLNHGNDIYMYRSVIMIVPWFSV